MKNGNSDELVSVAVPRRHYSLVLRTLADAMAGEGTALRPPAPSGSKGKKGHKDWTAEEIVRLNFLLSRPAARTMMDLACETPGQGVTFTQVVDKVGCELRTGRGDLAAMTRLIRKQFKRDNWPLRVTQTADGIAYQATPEIAAAWKRGPIPQAE